MAEDFLVNCIAFQIDKYNTNKTRNSASGRFQVHVFACNSYAAVTLHLSIGDNGFIHSMSSVRLQLKFLLRCFEASFLPSYTPIFYRNCCNY